MILLLVVCCLSCFLNWEHLKHTNQAHLSLCSWHLVQCLDLVDVTLVPRACSLVSCQLFYSYLLPEEHCSRLRKKEFFHPCLTLWGLLAQEAQEGPGHGQTVSRGDWQSSAGLWGTPALGAAGEGDGI